MPQTLHCLLCPHLPLHLEVLYCILQEAKVMDQTRGILTYVEQNCPGRFHSNIEYVTVAGKYIQGAGLRDKGATIPQKIVGAGYQQVNSDHRGIIWCSSGSALSLVNFSCMVRADQ